jgi:hypothetical protein
MNVGCSLHRMKSAGIHKHTHSGKWRLCVSAGSVSQFTDLIHILYHVSQLVSYDIIQCVTTF